MWFRTRAFSRPFWLTNGTYTETHGSYSSTGAAYTNTVIPNWFVAGSASDLIAPASSMACTPLTTGWKRFTNTFTVPTNGFYCVKFFCNSASAQTWIDEIQIVEGSVATAYVPAAVIEVGMDTADPGNNLFLSDAKTLRFRLWNHGPTTNATIRYDIVHGAWNTNLASGTVSTNALAGGTNTIINLTLPSLWGDQRITCYVTNVNDTWDETSVSLFPYAAQSGRDTNGMLGIHAHYSPYHLAHARKIGFTWNRILSPIFDARWTNLFPSITPPITNIFPAGTGHWLADYVFEYSVTNDLIPYVVLTAPDSSWHIQTNTTVDLMVADFTNYVGKAVFRWKEAPFNVKYWEVFNEPQQLERTNPPVFQPAVYANIFTNSARLIKVIDPTATVIGFGGYGQASQAFDAWTAFTPAFQADADILSFHFYPLHSGTFDPNTTEDYRGDSTANYDDMDTAFHGIRPLWNTETATRDIGGYHTIQVAFDYPHYWDNTTGWTSEAWKNELEVRQLPCIDRITYNFCRSVGIGMAQFNIQNGRMPDDTIFAENHPTIYELNGCLKPWAVALLFANHFVKRPGIGRVNVAANLWVEAWLHTNSLGTVMPIWNCDRANRTLTLSGSEWPAVYDTFGNLIQTNVNAIPTTRSVRYLVSGTLNALQLSNAVATASVATNQDVLPPGLTIDFSPIGSTVAWGGVSNAFKATAIDQTVMSYDNGSGTTTQTNVMYRWSLNGTTWSPWGVTNHFYHSFSGPGQYAVSWQAKDLAGNETAVLTGPAFGDMTPGATNILNVSGQANVGTLTVVQ